MTHDIRTWLENSGLGKYADVFAVNEIGMDVLTDLTKEDLEKLGVLLGDRLRLLKAIRSGASESASIVVLKPTAPTTDAGTQPDAIAAPPAPANDAERRPLTVMFCDMADSTSLSTRLDPEDLQDVIRAYQEVCTRLIKEYEGFIARYTGDGILVYFGYPKSLERNAERAVRSALGIIEGIAQLNRTLTRERNVEIAVRIGIATGSVVVGEIVGEGLVQERTVVGEAPNLAARFQGLAGRNGIVVGALTKEMLGDVFSYEGLGEHELKGISGRVKAWEVTGLRGDDTRTGEDDDNLDKGYARQLVGRDEETGLLRRAWQSTKDERRGQVVTISGEAGIGKSVLIDGLRAEVRAEGLPSIVFRCSPYHTSSALYPVIEHFKRLAGWQPDDDDTTRLTKLEEVLKSYDQADRETIPLFASLMSLPLPQDRYPPLNLTPQQQRLQTQDAIIALALEEAERQPLLQLWEDLHWADPSTLELVALLIDQAPTAGLLILLTARPEFVPPWPARSHITPITLNRLEIAHTKALVSHIAGMKPLPDEVVEHIVTKTDGVPLYVEELTKTILASEILRDTGESYELSGPLSSLAIPDTLQESLMARLDSLPQVRELAQIGSVLGREFAYEMISGLSTTGESTLQEGLRQLVEAELLYQRGRPPRARYIFKHALIQDAAYGSLLRRVRQKYHLKAAELIKEKLPESIDVQPEILAHHYSEADSHEQAANYWRAAGLRAAERSANAEAIAHMRRGIEELLKLPETPERLRTELDIQKGLGAVLIAAMGYGAREVKDTYTRAKVLCDQVGDKSDRFAVLRGLWNSYFVSAELHEARVRGEELMQLAEAMDDSAPLVEAHRVMGTVSFLMGDFVNARKFAERGIEVYDPVQHQGLAFVYGADPCVVCGAYAANALWMLGYPARAQATMDSAMSLVRELSHGHTETFALHFRSALRQYSHEITSVREYSRATVEAASKLGSRQWLIFGSVLAGWADAFGGEPEQGIKTLQDALDQFREEERFFAPYFLGLKAEAVGETGRLDEGLDVLATALQVAQTGGQCFHDSELNRLQGIFLLKKGCVDEAEASFEQALIIARDQEAKSFELRTATSLARLWCDQGKPDAARDLLKPVYDWFTEGLDTPDLKSTKALLDEIG